MKISVLYLGRIECFKYHLVACEDRKEVIRSPVPAILIEHPVLGRILYDTGNSPLYASAYPDSVKEIYPISEFISIETALREKGLTPADIDMLIISHLHFDHAGGMQYFKGTKAIKNVIVSEAELETAYAQTESNSEGPYIRSLFDIAGIVFRPIKEDTVLADDLQLFIQQSHTPGVLGMILETRSKGTVIATSDTVYTRESYDKELPPGGPINKTEQEFYDNLSRIKRLEKERSAVLLFGHDYDQIAAWHQEGAFE